MREQLTINTEKTHKEASDMTTSITVHLAALKIVAALYREGMINLDTYRKIVAQYAA
jgi:hypothetical protein